MVPRAEWAALQAKAAAQAMQLQAVTAQWEAERRRAEEIAAAVAGDLKSVMREVLAGTRLGGAGVSWHPQLTSSITIGIKACRGVG